MPADTQDSGPEPVGPRPKRSDARRPRGEDTTTPDDEPQKRLAEAETDLKSMTRQVEAAGERAALWEARATETQARLAEILRESRYEASRLVRAQRSRAPGPPDNARLGPRVPDGAQRRGLVRAAVCAVLSTLSLIACRASLRSVALGAVVVWRGHARAIWRHNFDAEYYRAVNPDVTEVGVPPALHYLFIGFREGREPSLDFSGERYLKANPDAAGWNPLLHFALHGSLEGRPFPAAER